MKKPPLPFVSITVIGLCVLVTAGIHFMPFPATEYEAAIFFGAYYKPFILCGEWWRFLTAGFVHITVWHLAMNMMALYMLGQMMERVYGGRRFLLLLLGASVCSYVFLFCMSGNVLTVGLSGGIYGVLAAAVFQIIKIRGWRYPSLRRALLETIVLNGLINFLPGIAWQGHLGGFFGGLLLAICLNREFLEGTLRKHAAIALIVLCGVTGLALAQNWKLPAKTPIYLKTDAYVLQGMKQYGLSAHAEVLAARLDRLYGITYLEEEVK